MKIEVIGSGCKKCKMLYDLTQKVVNSLGVSVSVLYSTDINKIINMGLMSSPVLTIDDIPVFVGILPDEDKLKDIITQKI